MKSVTQVIQVINNLSALEKFGLFASVIGLIVDTQSLAAILPETTNSTIPTSLITWVARFTSILYTMMLFNVFLRIRANKLKNELSNTDDATKLSKDPIVNYIIKSEKKQVDKSVLRCMYCIFLPLYSWYFIAFFDNDLSRIFFPIYWLSSDAELFINGVVAGCFVCYSSCNLIDSAIRSNRFIS